MPIALRPSRMDAGVLHIIGNKFFDLLLALFRVDGRSAALDDVGRAVELRRVTAVPELVERHERTVGCATP